MEFTAAPRRDGAENETEKEDLKSLKESLKGKLKRKA